MTVEQAEVIIGIVVGILAPKRRAHDGIAVTTGTRDIAAAVVGGIILGLGQE